ncbi:MAG TPA: hypothetical protein VF177_12380 [Anaerolineae bacterium]
MGDNDVEETIIVGVAHCHPPAHALAGNAGCADGSGDFLEGTVALVFVEKVGLVAGYQVAGVGHVEVEVAVVVEIGPGGVLAVGYQVDAGLI